MDQDFRLIHFKNLNYSKALDLQLESWIFVKENPSQALFLYGDHPDCLTLGRRCDDQEFKYFSKLSKSKNWGCFKVDRGGEITWHGKGQLVIYPIINLSFWNISVKKLICISLLSLEEYLLSLGLTAKVNIQDAGVYLEERKIAFVGFRIKEGVSFHGLSLNIFNDLNVFQSFPSCGLENRPVTSIFKESDSESCPAIEKAGKAVGLIFKRKLLESKTVTNCLSE